MNEAEQRQSHLARLLVAVDSLSSRCGGRSEGDYELTLENQQGQVLTFDNEGDRKALVTGLMLNARAKRLMEAGKWSDALETLVLCEEAFACAHPTHVEAIDNVGLVHMDIVWCIFQLQDASRMAVARGYLEKARAGLTRAHGSNLERLRTLQGGFKPELATYVRLELLEGVAAYHEGDDGRALERLEAARSKWGRLQIEPASIEMLATMGFTRSEATRALRFCGGRTDRAAEFVVEERNKAAQRRDRELVERGDRRAAQRFGTTAKGHLVDMPALRSLEGMGYPVDLAAGACKVGQPLRGENDMAALELLQPQTLDPYPFKTDLAAGACRFSPIFSRTGLLGAPNPKSQQINIRAHFFVPWLLAPPLTKLQTLHPYCFLCRGPEAFGERPHGGAGAPLRPGES
mmetsp:Transcript_14612/g.46454  ORF Transcript_14612/g.46454 Transcript_14612/m.46454 type:complete len:404 (+) Transcript_14612:529-1740(+)